MWAAHIVAKETPTMKKDFWGVEGDGSRLYLEENDLRPILAQKSYMYC